MEAIKLQIVSYDDSLFTNAHTLVTPLPVNDGRGTFSHLGVKMEGLESARHLDFHCIASSGSEGVLQFQRDRRMHNKVVLSVDPAGSVACIEELVFDTRYFTRNNVHTVYSVVFYEECDGSNDGVKVLANVSLSGDATKTVKLSKPACASKIVLELSEGGLARFIAKGTIIPGKQTQRSRLKDLLHENSQNIVTFGVSDASYGCPSLCFRPSREGMVMAGWESCRHSYRQRFCFQLKYPCQVEMIEIDTYMHCLNAFKSICILACYDSSSDPARHGELVDSLPLWKLLSSDGKEILKVKDEDIYEKMSASSVDYLYQIDMNSNGLIWKVLLPFVELKRDTLHTFTHENGWLKQLDSPLNTFAIIGIPDGGIHRLGFYGNFINP